MKEESPQSFPLPQQNDVQLVCNDIKLTLEREGIYSQRISIHGTVITVTTDKEVPEKIKSNICEHVACKGITIKFLTSG